MLYSFSSRLSVPDGLQEKGFHFQNLYNFSSEQPLTKEVIRVESIGLNYRKLRKEVMFVFSTCVFLNP